MHNVSATAEKGDIVIRIKADTATIRSAPPSKSGKTRLLASTGPGVDVMTPNGSVRVALNAMVSSA